MKPNFQLFNNFKQAAQECGFEVIPGKNYYAVNLPNKRYIWCWTPLNKMWDLMNYYDNKDWDRALNHLKNNFSDFHLEIDSIGHCEDIMECFIKEISNPNITVKEIKNIFEILQDDQRLERRRLLSTIEYSEETV